MNSGSIRSIKDVLIFPVFMNINKWSSRSFCEHIAGKTLAITFPFSSKKLYLTWWNWLILWFMILWFYCFMVSLHSSSWLSSFVASLLWHGQDLVDKCSNASQFEYGETSVCYARGWETFDTFLSNEKLPLRSHWM